ncbi:Short-chain dehydrogenase/reductase SDR [Neofusicoccum parvum]|nr:Short-chain dehydrogenase/reductase SDR [Neofusicoccum parvum]
MTSHPEFGHDTKATEVADAFSRQIKDRIVAITGISRGGIGGATALAFAKHDPALLILISRTQSKLDEIAADINMMKPKIKVKCVLVDLVSQASVRHAADEVRSLTTRIDILINNAGLTSFKRKWSPERIDVQLAGNHIGPFLLTNLLMDRILAAASASPPGSTRVINVSSGAHRMAPFRFHDYNLEGKPVPPEEEDKLAGWPEELRTPVDGYVSFHAYCQSKTASVLFTVELNRRLYGKGVVSYSIHPGTIHTEGQRGMDPAMIAALAETLKQSNPKPSIEEGASTTMIAALDPGLIEIKGSSYLEDCQLNAAEPHATDAKNAEKLWTLSEDLVNQAF